MNKLGRGNIIRFSKNINTGEYSSVAVSVREDHLDLNDRSGKAKGKWYEFVFPGQCSMYAIMREAFGYAPIMYEGIQQGYRAGDYAAVLRLLDYINKYLPEITITISGMLYRKGQWTADDYTSYTHNTEGILAQIERNAAEMLAVPKGVIDGNCKESNKSDAKVKTKKFSIPELEKLLYNPELDKYKAQVDAMLEAQAYQRRMAYVREQVRQAKIRFEESLKQNTGNRLDSKEKEITLDNINNPQQFKF